MKTTLQIRFLILSVCAALAFACVREPAVDGFCDGRPVTARIEFAAADASRITVTRASTATYSTIASLTIFVYNSDGSRLECSQDFTFDPQKDGWMEKDSRIYQVELETTTGVKQMCAVANAGDVSVWDVDGLEDLLAQAKAGAYTFDQLQAELVRLQTSISEEGNLPLFPATRMLLSGSDRISISRVGQTKTGIADKRLKLKRAVAEVVFNIRNGNDRIEFNPSHYQVFNVPIASRIGAGAKEPVSRTAEGYFNTGRFVAPAKNNQMYTISFFMPENIQEAGGNAADYTDYAAAYRERDRWDVASSGEGAAPGDKLWTNAPQYATFVVISGAFNELDAPGGHLIHTGSVQYTIHLGDFSESGAMNDYSVERNCRYIYNVTINGVDNIIAEAEKFEHGGTEQPGGEGGVIAVQGNSFDYNVDSHFEQVYIEYDITAMAAAVPSSDEHEIEREIAQQLQLIVETPYTTFGYVSPYKVYLENQDDPAAAKTEALRGIDYKWVEFWPQTAATIAPYPGRPAWKTPDNKDLQADSKFLIDVYDLCVALGKAVRTLKTTGTLTVNTTLGERGDIYIQQSSTRKYVARFTAFVDEYYYLENPLTGETVTSWGAFVNKDIRRMLVVTDVKQSDDGNSQLVTAHSNISQRSIQTFFDAQHAPEINAIGLESFNETERVSFGTPNAWGTDMNNGYLNTLKMIGGRNATVENASYSYGTWSDYINTEKSGYMSTNTSTDPIASHKLSGVLAKNYSYAACMSRNRDLDGDGKISRDEIRWYMPAVYEYFRIGIGAQAISSEAQLYYGEKSEMNKSTYDAVGYSNLGQIYYTSTSSKSTAMIFWAVEKGAFGTYLSGGSYASRCIRHLPSDNKTIVTNGDSFGLMKKTAEGNYLLDFRDRLQPELLRPTRTEGFLVVHDEDSPYNRFYDGLVISKDYQMSGSTPVTCTHSEAMNAGGNTNPCDGYSEKADKSDLGKWRVPNLVEFMSMVSHPDELLTYTYGGKKNTPSPIFCCTSFSNSAVRLGFKYQDSGITCPNPDAGSTNGYVRCVRDATDGELETATAVD